MEEDMLKEFKVLQDTIFPYLIKKQVDKTIWLQVFSDKDYNIESTSDIKYTDDILKEMYDFFLTYNRLDFTFLLKTSLKKIELNLNTIFVWHSPSLTWRIRNIDEACVFVKKNILDELIKIEFRFKQLETYFCKEKSIYSMFLELREQINNNQAIIKKEVLSYINRTYRRSSILFNNQFPFLIAFGDKYVLDLKTKVKRIRDYNDYFTFAIEHRNLKLVTKTCFPISDWFDAEHLREIQLILGSFLTGEHDQTFYIFYGQGSNGKSTLINILKILLGDYFISVSNQLFSNQNTLKLEEDYKLINRRLAVLDAQEITKFNESKLIALTEKYKNCKFLLSLNKLPKLSSEYSTKRRLINIPFEYTFKPIVLFHKDKELKKNLEIDYDYVFSWLLEGCSEYLNSNKTITQLAHDYIMETRIFDFDPFEDFAKNNIIITNNRFDNITFRDMYLVYLNYANSKFQDEISEGNERTNEGNEKYKDILKEKDFLKIAKTKYLFKRTSAGNKFFYIKVRELESDKELEDLETVLNKQHNFLFT